IVSGIERLGAGTTFLGQRLFGATLTSDASGASVGTGNLDPTTIGNVRDPLSGETYSLADLRTGGQLADNANSKLAAQVMETAIKQIAGLRGELGAFQNRLTTMGNVRDVTRINLADALSQIQDTDYAAEANSFVRNQLLSQTSIATTAIANSQPQSVLELL